MEWEFWFSGGVFCWRGGHKTHGKVAGKGNELILSRVNKGGEEWGIASVQSGKAREVRNENKIKNK